MTPGAKCLFLNALPFADEVRRMEWAPPPKDKAKDKEGQGTPGVSEAQAAAADVLVEALDFCNPAVGGEAASAAPSTNQGKHAVRPKDVVNPSTQRAYQAILQKALRPTEGLPAPDWRVMAPLQPSWWNVVSRGHGGGVPTTPEGRAWTPCTLCGLLPAPLR